MGLNGSCTVSCRLEAWRGGAFYKILKAQDMAVRMDGGAGIKTSLSCRIAYDPGLDLLGDRLRPVQVVDGVEYPMGEFLVSTAAETVEKGGRGWEVEAYDQALLLRQAATTGALRFAAGTPYLDAVRSLLAECGVVRVIAEPCALAMAADREDWEVGTSYLSIANGLLAAINFGSLWFDRDGAARLQPERAATAANLTQVYRTASMPFPADQRSALIDGIRRETDAYAACNVFTAVYSPPDAAPMVAVAVNDNPLSPLSTVRRGRRICAPAEFVDDIADQDALRAYAEGLLAASLLAGETVEFETAPVPAHWIGEVVALGETIYKETGWELRLGPGGSYSHTARRSAI